MLGGITRRWCRVIAAARSHLKLGSLDKAQSQSILSSSQVETSRFGETYRSHSGPDLVFQNVVSI